MWESKKERVVRLFEDALCVRPVNQGTERKQKVCGRVRRRERGSAIWRRRASREAKREAETTACLPKTGQRETKERGRDNCLLSQNGEQEKYKGRDNCLLAQTGHVIETSFNLSLEETVGMVWRRMSWKRRRE